MDGIDPALAAAIAGCLAFDPEDRPLHAGALAEALRAVAGRRSGAGAGPRSDRRAASDAVCDTTLPRVGGAVGCPARSHGRWPNA